MVTTTGPFHPHRHDCPVSSEDHQSEHIALGYAIGSSISGLCCIAFFWLFYLFPRHRKHPSELLLFRCVCDFVVAGSDVSSWLTSATVTDCGVNNMCKALGFVNLFAISASDAWYLMLSVDLLLAIRNPFTFHTGYMPYYHVSVWGYAAIVSFLSLGLNKLGLSVNSLCFLFENPQDLSDTAYAISFSLMPQLFMFIFAFAVMSIAYRAFGEGLPNTVKTRKRVLTHCRNYVVIIGVYWLILTLVTGLHFSYVDRRRHRNIHYIRLFVFVRSLRGVVDVLAWLTNADISIHERVKAMQSLCFWCRPTDTGSGYAPGLEIPLVDRGESVASSSDDDQRENINFALRRDLILCTAWGILDALKPAPSSTAHIETSSNSRRLYLPQPYRNKSFVVTDYDGEKFAALRSLRGIDNDTYSKSFSVPAEGEAEMLEKFTEGRSGSFLYFTYDYKYIVKTVTNTERKLLQSLLDSYLDHLRDYEATLLTRFCGLHAIQMSSEQKFISFVVMENVFAKAKNLTLHETYDLKGSTVNRRVIYDGMDARSFRRTRKDLDLQRAISVGEKIKAALKSQMACDVTFLNEHQIMDYSLLVGVHNCCESPDPGTCCDDRRREEQDLVNHHHPIFRLIAQGMRGKGPSYAPDTESVFFCGIIDMLQLYDLGKSAEHFMKTHIMGKDSHGVSCVPPDEYASRFLDNIVKKIE